MPEKCRSKKCPKNVRRGRKHNFRTFFDIFGLFGRCFCLVTLSNARPLQSAADSCAHNRFWGVQSWNFLFDNSNCFFLGLRPPNQVAETCLKLPEKGPTRYTEKAGRLRTWYFVRSWFVRTSNSLWQHLNFENWLVNQPYTIRLGLPCSWAFLESDCVPDIPLSFLKACLHRPSTTKEAEPHVFALPTLQKTFVDFFFEFGTWEFCIAKWRGAGGSLWWIFSGFRFPQNDARKLLKKFAENLEQNSGQNSGRIEKIDELSFCSFSDLTHLVQTWMERLIRDRKGTPKNFCDKDFAELSGELSGAICLKTLVLMVVTGNPLE